MKQQSSKHASHGKEHHDFISLTSLSLLVIGLLVLLYLLSYCHPPDGGHSPLIRFAYAREQEASENEISDAVSLSDNRNHQITLSPYSHRYFYIVFQKNCSLQILSRNSSIRVTCYSQKGNRLSIPKENHQYHFEQISGTILCPGDRVFLKFANMSTKPSTIKVKYGKSSAKKTAKKHTATPMPKNAVSGKKPPKAQKKTQTAKCTAKSTPKPTQRAKKRPQPSSLSVKPHFLRMALGSRKELSLSLGKASLNLADCTYFLTDTSVLTIQGNTLTAKKAGTAILYVRSKKSTICGSCLIRVTEK